MSLFVDDPDDAQAAQQRPAAVAAMPGRVFIAVTVLAFDIEERKPVSLPGALDAPTPIAAAQ